MIVFPLILHVFLFIVYLHGTRKHSPNTACIFSLSIFTEADSILPILHVFFSLSIFTEADSILSILYVVTVLSRKPIVFI